MPEHFWVVLGFPTGGMIPDPYVAYNRFFGAFDDAVDLHEQLVAETSRTVFKVATVQVVYEGRETE